MGILALCRSSKVDAQTALLGDPLWDPKTPVLGSVLGSQKGSFLGPRNLLSKTDFLRKLAKERALDRTYSEFCPQKRVFWPFWGYPPKPPKTVVFWVFWGFGPKRRFWTPNPKSPDPTTPPKTPQNPDTAPKPARIGWFLGRNLGACSMQEYPHRHPRI